MLEANMADVVSKVIDSLKATTPYVLDAAIRQVVLDGYKAIIETSLFGLIGAYTGYKAICHFRKLENDHEEELSVPIIWIGGILSITSSVLTLFILCDVIDYLGNPQYWAIVNLISRLKGN